MFQLRIGQLHIYSLLVVYVMPNYIGFVFFLKMFILKPFSGFNWNGYFVFVLISPIVFQSSPGAGKIISKWFVRTCIWSDSGTFCYRSSFIIICHAAAWIQTEGRTCHNI